MRVVLAWGALQQAQPLVPDSRSCSEHLSPESCLSDPQVWPNQCLGNQGTVSCVALMRGKDEHGQWHIKPWPGPSSVNFFKKTSSVRLSITLAHNRSANKMQVLTSSTSCSIRRVLSRDWKETGKNMEILQMTLSNTDLQLRADRMFILHSFPSLQMRPSAGHWWSLPLQLYGWLMQHFPAYLKAAAVFQACARLAHTLQQHCSELQVFHLKNNACGFQLRLFRNLIGDF